MKLNVKRPEVAAWPWVTAAVLLLAAGRAAALDIVPTFVDEPSGAADRQTWDATRQAVVQRAIDDWESKVLDDRTINVRFDFTRKGIGDYLGLWEGDFTLPFGTNVYPWTPGVSHAIHFNSDHILRPGTKLAFVPAGQSPTAAQWDALTLTRHELGHLMGFSGSFYYDNWGEEASDKWRSRVTVAGGNATFDPGGLNVRLESPQDVAHISETGAFVNDLMTASLPNGVRRDISGTDVAMLQVAFGYQVVPEPAGLAALGVAAVLLLRRGRRAG